MADIYMRIILSAQNSASSVIRSVGRDLGTMGEFVPAAIAAGVALAGIGIALGIAVKQAADFQQGLNRLITGAGDTTDNMQKMGQAILGISADTGVMTGPLLQAMYQIISAGQRGAQAEDTLAVAAKGSVIEQAKIVDVAKALTTAMTDYGTTQFNATQFMNGYTRAVQLGKITLEELSKSMGPILPLAKNLGISFADVAGAMSTMTNAGIPADRAATSLRFLFQSLENPTKKALTAMKDFGVNSIALGNELKVSLPGALQMVYDAARKAGPEGSVPFNRAVSDMIGGQRSLQAYLALTGSHMKTFAGDSKAIATAMDGSKTAVLGWDVAQRNFNVQMDKAKAALGVLAITIGSQLLPLLTRIVGAVTPLITAFAKWISNADNAKTALAILGGVIAGLATIVLAVAIPALIAFIATMWPILLAGAAVALVVTGIILAMQHWGQITQWLGNVWKTVSTAIGNFFSMVGTKIHDIVTGIIGWFNNLAGVFKVLLGVALVVFAPIVALILGVIIVVQHWGAIMQWFGNVFSSVGSFIHSIITDIGNAFSGLGSLISGIWNGIVGDIKAAINVIIGLINAFIGGIDSIGIDIGPVHIHPSIPTIPYLARGALDFAGGLAYVHAGEVLTYLPQHANVYPANRVRAMSSEGGGFGGTTNNFYLNISTLAGSRSEIERMADLIEQEMGRRFRGQTPGFASGGIFG